MTNIESAGITRRAALRASTATAACLLGSTVAMARAAQEGQQRKAASRFQSLCQEWLAIAAEYPERGVAEFPADEYLFRLCAALTKLGGAGVPDPFKVGWDKDGLRAGPVWIEGEIFVVEQKLAPGTVLRAHNHPAFNGVSLVTAGDCEFRHFEPVGEVPDYRTGLGEHFHLRETRAGILGVGRMSSFSRTRENIHWFRAGDDGATIVDFSMSFGGSSGDFSALEIDLEPLDAERRLHEGCWIGNPYR